MTLAPGSARCRTRPDIRSSFVYARGLGATVKVTMFSSFQISQFRIGR